MFENALEIVTEQEIRQALDAARRRVKRLEQRLAEFCALQAEKGNGGI